MLETKNLVKIYKPKKGVPVVALNDVSLKFPDKGMVFLLGKSGSGKSTLLNVLGGLDRCNKGEILIKGKSSKTFRQRHFDSYRNTYVGFIFQEYNILDEFSVGTNIALALQLQGIKPSTERINEILKEVDLEGYGNRKPNELSGGQKQRVAIARALVKNPQIIMADEPTGALDSATGRQILTTLKKLSRDKLVIVVSHDREFAEQYGDRIIELADGRVIRDVERRSSDLPGESQHILFAPESVTLPEGYELTDEDKAAVCEYIQKMLDQSKAPKFQLWGDQSEQKFLPTDVSGITTSQDGYRLIRSRLPLRYAFKLGSSGLKYKRFRLVMTILLSVIAFTLFGLADTMASYSYVTTSVKSLTDPDSQISYAALEKIQRVYYSDDYYYEDFSALTQEDFALLEQQTGISFHPVYSNSAPITENNWYYNLNMDFSHHVSTEDMYDYYGLSDYYAFAFSGYVEINEALMEDLGAELIAGELPAPGSNEMAISTHVLETFQEYGYRTDYNGSSQRIRSAEDILGVQLTVGSLTYTVSGVVDTGIDYNRYSSLKEELDSDDFKDILLRFALATELDYSVNYSLSGLAMVSEGQLARIHAATAIEQPQKFVTLKLSCDDYNFGDSCYGFSTISELSAEYIVWLDGIARTELAPNEIILPQSVYMSAMYEGGECPEALDFNNLFYNAKDPDYSGITNLSLTLYDKSTEDSYDVSIVGIFPDYEYYCESYCYVNQEIYTAALSVLGSEDSSAQPPMSQAIAAMPDSNRDIQRLVELSDRVYTTEDGTEYQFNLMNPVSFELKNLHDIFLVLRQVFLIIGIVFVVFASLLFSNFIGTSISYKKREIGILRAIGSRSNDVFRIFFAESFIIAMINFVLALAATIGISAIINNLIRYQAGLLLTILNVGIRQIGLLFGVCLLIAAVASFLPVYKIASKRPIDAIRDR